MNMPQFRIGNMFDDTNQLFTTNILITTNSFIKKDGTLVMGRGAALEYKNKFSSFNVDKMWGDMIKEACGHLGMYGVIVEGRYGIFQVKRHFKDKADLDLIRYSIAWLLIRAIEKPQEEFHVNYPGIGFGRLRKEDVAPLLQVLPDNVFIWKKE